MNCRVFPPEEMIDATVSLPLSKSISNRALIMNALSGSKSIMADVAKCDDTDVMVNALASEDENVNVGAAGTAMRFLTAFYASQEGRSIVIDGSERMRHRPIKVLVDALRECGAEIEYVSEEGFPPLKISGTKLDGGRISLPASVSSQYISALLMVAPTMKNGLNLVLEGEVISRPYILMTLSMMRQWGIESEFNGNEINVSQQKYIERDFRVEADWSAASYWYEIAALSSGSVNLLGLRQDSNQGDSRLTALFENLGVVSSFCENDTLELFPSPELSARLKLDLSEQPDLAQTIIVTSCLLGIPFRITGLSTLRIKETDRLEALRAELLKLGFVVSVEGDSVMSWDGDRVPIIEIPSIDTYQDHRMAMAFAPAALMIPGIRINNMEVVSKSYPDYWQHLCSAGFVVVDADAVAGSQE